MVKAKVPGSVADRGKTVDLDNISNEDLAAAIDSWIHSRRDRIILKLRLIDGFTYSQTVEYLYEHEKIILSEKQISRIIQKTEDILFKHI